MYCLLDLPGIESGIAEVIPRADDAMEVSLHPKIARRHDRSLTSLLRVSRDVPVSRPSGGAGGKSWISRGSRGTRRAAAGARDGAAADRGDFLIQFLSIFFHPNLMEEMVELGDAEPPFPRALSYWFLFCERALSYWSRDSVRAINGPSTAIPVVTELGRYLDENALENYSVIEIEWNDQCGFYD